MRNTTNSTVKKKLKSDVPKMMQSKGEEEACEDDFPQKSIMWNPRAEDEAEGKNRVKGEAELEVCLLVEREVREELG